MEMRIPIKSAIGAERVKVNFGLHNTCTNFPALLGWVAGV